ncbi:phosphoglycerate mutase [Ramlibacter sp. AN1133]|uniref:phosphoglycerate mutase n=1 Tax=Ramlibacter sp. AN1133 TaxID=3133429 RepID=UPI0030C1F2B7
MLVPFAHCRAQPCREALRGLALPQFRKLLQRLVVEGTDEGDPDSLSTPHERAVARAHGLQPADGLVPMAAMQVQQAGGDAGSTGWAWITPSHWRVGQDHIDMVHPQELQLDGDDSQALLAAMQPYFAEDGIALGYDAPLRWLARGDVFRGLPSASLDRVIGRGIANAWMPGGPDAGPVRRLQQEMQMLLYTLPLNDERQRGGLLPVNSFWISGTGALPAGEAFHPAPGLQVTPYLRDAALLGDWHAWAEAWQQLDARDGARLNAEAERGTPVRVTLCGESSARTWTSAGASGWRRMAGWFGSPTVADLLEGL